MKILGHCRAKVNDCLFSACTFSSSMQSLSSKIWYYWTSVTGIFLVSSCRCQMVNFDQSREIIEEMKNPA